MEIDQHSCRNKFKCLFKHEEENTVNNTNGLQPDINKIKPRDSANHKQEELSNELSFLGQQISLLIKQGHPKDQEKNITTQQPNITTQQPNLWQNHRNHHQNNQIFQQNIPHQIPIQWSPHQASNQRSL